jgi:hypothetical protein
MKRTALVVAAVLCVFVAAGEPVFSYDLELGLKAGFMRSKADISRGLPGVTYGSIDDYSFGSYLTFFFLWDQLGLQTEIYRSFKGFDVLEMDEGQEISSKYKISYTEIPLLVSYRFPLKGRFKPGVVFGPYFGFPKKAREVQTAFGETEESELGDNLKKTDVGLVFGGNVRGKLGPVTVILSARYNLGLVNISKDMTEVSWNFSKSDTIKNRAWTVSLGIALNLIKCECE